jgi:hypothetical protein
VRAAAVRPPLCSELVTFVVILNEDLRCRDDSDGDGDGDGDGDDDGDRYGDSDDEDDHDADKTQTNFYLFIAALSSGMTKRPTANPLLDIFTPVADTQR